MFDLQLITTTLFFALSCIIVPHFRSKRLPLPPSLKPIPIFGNLFQLPRRSIWIWFDEQSRALGSPIIYLDILASNVIVINSLQVMKDLLDRRSENYAHRPKMPMVTDLMGWNIIFLFMQPDKLWRAHRRLFEQEFNKTAVKRFREHHIASTHRLVKRLLDDPENFLGHIRQMSGEIIMSIAYGIQVLPSNDPYLQQSERALRPMSKAAFPGRYFVDFLPLLRYVPEGFPGATFKRQARLWKQETVAMIEEPFAVAKRQLVPPSVSFFFLSSIDSLEKEETGSTNSFTTARLADKSFDDPEWIIKNTAGAMYAGGTDTTVSAITYFFLAMLSNPESQARAQKELDRGLIPGQLPTFEDMERFPYLTALVQEVLRWGNVAPIAPHMSLKEDEYLGYRIPAGTLVIANLWAMLHDEEIYPDPDSFIPERFLTDGRLNNVQDPRDIIFGAGRRICPGRFMAWESIWIAIATILTAFNISKRINKDGNTIEPSGQFAGGIVCAPHAFVCDITPRRGSTDIFSDLQT
ncbi:cytochrome P450 [Mycena floridula]|nr:cytochrome P450 [Mycena floridula]